MTTYAFKAIDLSGRQTRGEIEAESKQAVADQLKARGLVVLDISDRSGSKEIRLPWSGRVKAGDFTVMTRQLATMVSSGMSLLRALYVLEAQTESTPLREALVKVRKDVEAGLPLSDALERHPKVFNQLYVAMVRAGETGGVLEQSLLRIAGQLEADESLRRQVKGAMIYPSMIITFAFVVLLAIVAFIVPIFEGIFEEFGGDLPLLTQLTVAASNVLTDRWYAFVGAVVAAVYVFRRWRRSERGRRQWDTLRLKLPLRIGDIVQKVALARWARTLSALTTAGVPLLAALEITGKTAGNWQVEKAMNDVIASVRSGGTLTGPLKDSPVFPAMVTHMVGVGEETGALDTMLTKVAEFYEDQVAASVKALTSLLEPVMIVIVGGIVGFIVVAMYMPLFRVYDQIQ